MTVQLPRPTATEALARAVVRRDRSLLDEDLREHRDEVEARVQGRRVLVVGGAGSIGSSTVSQLAAFAPARLHVVDVDENGLTELVRDLRSRGAVHERTELRTAPVDAGSPTMLRLLRAAGGYDVALNFAAVKHVRSEKDVFSLLRMLEVNVRTPRRLLEWLGPGCERYFAVSTDKAANPVNLMGASKRAMEHVILDEDLGPEVTSARFANVAFSQGSLLDGWLTRLSKGQPWAVPTGARRYFVSLEESGHLCLLAATLGPAGHVVIPDLDPRTQLRDLVEVAEDVLAAMGLRALHCHDEDEARHAVARRAEGTWPLLVTPLDTAGEKEFEEFTGDGDVVRDMGLRRLRAVRPPTATREQIDGLLAGVDAVVDDLSLPVDEGHVKSLIASVVPELRHRVSALSLDSRM